MSSKIINIPQSGRAEQAFRDAFDRLKKNNPIRLAKGTAVSQNNVAKEAGCDPSALRKSRYPSLIAEIQRWIADHESVITPSPRQIIMAQRGRNRLLKEKIEVLKAQRDHALSLLAQADEKIIELMFENISLRAKLPTSNVTSAQNYNLKNTNNNLAREES